MTIASTEDLEALPEGTMVVLGAPSAPVRQWRRTGVGLAPAEGPEGVLPPALFRGYISQGLLYRDEDRDARPGDLFMRATTRRLANVALYLILSVSEDGTTMYRTYHSQQRGVPLGAPQRAAANTWTQSNLMRRVYDVPEDFVSAALCTDLLDLVRTPQPEPEPETEETVPVSVTVTGTSVPARAIGRPDTTSGGPSLAWVFAYTYTVTGKPGQCACHTLDRDRVAAHLPPNTLHWDVTVTCPNG